MNKRMFSGVGVALITPFNKKGEIDYASLSWLVDFLIRQGVDFLVPCGTTGESPTLSHEEHIRVIEFVVEFAGGRVPILAGTGSNNTDEAVGLTKSAKQVGADGALVVSPYYNKPMPAGLMDYYIRVAGVGLPVILYDIPGRTAKGVPFEVIRQLASEKAIIGIKWASGDFSQLMTLRSDLTSDFLILSGDDNLTLPLMALGGDGVISVAAHLVPAKLVKMCQAVSSGKIKLARKIHYDLLSLFSVLFIETNPIPVKEALGIIHPDIFSVNFRSPLSRMSGASIQLLKTTLREMGFISN